MDTTHPLLAAFELRLQQLELPDEPANIADFVRPGELDATGGPEQLLLESASLTPSRPAHRPAPGDQLIPLFEASLWPIPLPDADPSPAQVAATAETIPAPVDPAPWDIRETHPTVAAWVPRRSADPLRAIVIAAVSIPLFLSSTPALATAAPEIQRPKTDTAPERAPEEAPLEPAQPPQPPQPATDTAPATAPTLPPEPEPLGERDPYAEPEASATPEDAAASAPVGVSFDVASASSGGGVTEQEWQAMRGLEVKLMLAQGPRLGRLASADGANIVFVDNLSGGKLYTIPKSAVMELRGVVGNGNGNQSNGRPLGVPDPRLPSGAGLLAGGIVAAAIGTPFFISGVAIGAACGSSCASLTLPLALTGVLGLGAGIPMIIFGARRRKAYKRSMFETVRLTPSFGGTRQAWTGSLTLRF